MAKIKTRFLPQLLVLALSALTFSAPAWAYYDVLDNGEILAPGRYKVTGGLQALTDRGGLNAGAIFDAGFGDEFGARGLVGIGDTDISFGGLFKWMPIPDIENQPAIGFNAGLLYAKDADVRDITFRFEPLVSKKIVVNQSAWTPYASLPIGLRSRDSDASSNHSDVTWQLVAGTQLQLEQWKELQFIAEIGADLDHALSHVSVAAIYYFDQQ
jgi:hypothetical protein